MKELSNIKCFILDMDGTIYLGDKLYNFTHDFLKTVKASGRNYKFFTNNSSKNAEAYIDKLAKMGIQTDRSDMLISNDVIIRHIKKNYPGAPAYVIGTKFLIDDFHAGGIEVREDADLVVLGFDVTLDYKKLVIGCDLLRAKKPFLAVNPDLNCPVEGGFIPDCGSMAKLMTASTGAVPEYFGKPSRHALEYMLEKCVCKPDELAVIGDRLYTDIALTEGTEATSILVLSGETQREDLKDSAYKPDIVVNDLSFLKILL